MRINKIIVVAIVIVCCGAAALAARYLGGGKDGDEKMPDVREEMKKIATRIGFDDATFSITGSIRITDSEDASKVKEESSFQFTKSGESFYSQLSTQITMSDGKIAVQVDTATKLIIITAADPGMIDNMKSILPAMDSLLNDTTIMKASLTGNNAQRVIAFTNALTPNIKGSRIAYDATTYHVQYAEIDWWKHPDMIASMNGVWTAHITYGAISHTPVDVNKKIREVVQYKDNKPVVTDKYKSYTIKSAI